LKPAVRNEVKAKQLDEKLGGASSIEQAAQKAGSKVVPVQNIVFCKSGNSGASLSIKLSVSIFGFTTQ